MGWNGWKHFENFYLVTLKCQCRTLSTRIKFTSVICFCDLWLVNFTREGSLHLKLALQNHKMSSTLIWKCLFSDPWELTVFVTKILASDPYNPEWVYYVITTCCLTYLVNEMRCMQSRELINLVSPPFGTLTATSHLDMGSGVGRTSEQSIGVAVASETLPRAAL